MMRIEVAQNILISAQERYNKALLEHGAGSYEVFQAQQQLERIQNYVTRANIRATASTAAFITQLAIESDLLKTATLAQIGHRAAVYATTVAHYAEAAALWVKAKALAAASAGAAVPLMVAGVATVAGLAGYGLAGGFTPKSPSEVTINTNVTAEGVSEEEVGQALQESVYQSKVEYKRQTEK